MAIYIDREYVAVPIGEFGTIDQNPRTMWRTYEKSLNVLHNCKIDIYILNII